MIQVTMTRVNKVRTVSLPNIPKCHQPLADPPRCCLCFDKPGPFPPPRPFARPLLVSSVCRPEPLERYLSDDQLVGSEEGKLRCGNDRVFASISCTDTEHRDRPFRLLGFVSNAQSACKDATGLTE